MYIFQGRCTSLFNKKQIIVKIQVVLFLMFFFVSLFTLNPRFHRSDVSFVIHHKFVINSIFIFLFLIDIESNTFQENISSKSESIITWEEVSGEQVYAHQVQEQG